MARINTIVRCPQCKNEAGTCFWKQYASRDYECLSCGIEFSFKQDIFDNPDNFDIHKMSPGLVKHYTRV